MRSFLIATAALACLAISAPAANAAMAAESGAKCNAMTAAELTRSGPTAHFESVTWHAKTEPVQSASGPGMTTTTQVPSHCEIIGKLQNRAGQNGQAYAVRFHLRLPADWNGRFFFQGGGGSNGELGDALGRGASRGKSAIELGYAVVSQDSGHNNATNTDEAFNGAVAFGFDPQARANYGHLSLKIVSQAAKTLIRTYYGRAPRYSYFVGCSKGGQEGMTFAQLYPEEFDGIIAAAPGFSLPRAALAEAWDVQSFGALVRTPGQPLDPAKLKDAFTPGDMTLLRGAILKACDGDDGLVDGIVGDIYRCTDEKVQTQLEAITCSDAVHDNCLSAALISALTRVVHGPVNSAGRPLYVGWFWPTGVEGETWRMWKIGTSNGQIPALNLALGGSSLAAVFLTPPVALPGGQQVVANFQTGFDFDRDGAGIYAVAAPFTTSAWHDIGSRSPDLRAFRAHGGRLIVPHGESDPVFSLKDTLNWFDEVNALNSGRAADFVRVFPVPGMCHCGGGQSTDNYDAFSALVAWVESGKAPDSLVGTAGPSSPWPGRQRPICVYPKVARYNGSGDIEKAASFSCRS